MDYYVAKLLILFEIELYKRLYFYVLTRINKMQVCLKGKKKGSSVKCIDRKKIFIL